MLEIKNLSVYYGVINAIKNVSFKVNRGEIVCLIGSNGAGKTTILRTISGLIQLKSGIISFENKNISGISADKIVHYGISHVPEGRHVFNGLSVRENLQLGAFIRKDSNLKSDFDNIFTQFPILKKRINQDSATLSGGEQQMLAMGRALIAKPQILLLDEPSMGLAPIYIKKIFSIIKDIQKKGTTVLLVEQNANMALSISDRGYILEHGKIIMNGTKEELLKNKTLREAYLGK